MTAMIGIDALDGAIGMHEAIDLLERTIAHEAAGRTSVSPKFVTDFENGSMRILFAADGEAGYCAMKAYHNIRNAGTRYVVLLYSMKDGELLALIDGRLDHGYAHRRSERRDRAQSAHTGSRHRRHPRFGQSGAHAARSAGRRLCNRAGGGLQPDRTEP